MKATKTTTTAYELRHDCLIIGADKWRKEFYLKTPDGVMCYNAEEMNECFGLTNDQIENIKQVLSNF